MYLAVTHTGILSSRQQNQHDLKSDISIWISMTPKRGLISHNSV